MKTTVKKIHKDGIEISLMNGSKWRLKNIGDLTKTVLWYPTQRIEVNEYENDIFTLSNLNSSTPDEEIPVLRIR